MSSGTARSPVHMRCSEHDGKPYEFYCRCCESLCCSMCILVSHRDHTGDVSDASSVLPEHMDNIKKLYEQASAHLETAQDMMDAMSETIGKLKENKDCAERRIRSYFHRMRNILVDREHHFINIVRRTAEEKKKVSNDTRKSVSDLLQGLVASVKELWDLSLREDDIMVLKEETKLSQELDTMLENLKQLQANDQVCNPNTTIILPCVEDQNFEKVCRLIGEPSFKVCHPDCNKGTVLEASQNDTQESVVLSPPPLPPRPTPLSPLGVKERTSTNVDLISVRPVDHPRSKSSVEISRPTEDMPMQPMTTPPPIPPKSPQLSNNRSSHLPQWLLDIKEQKDKENKQSSATVDNNIVPEAESLSTATKKPPKPKPRRNIRQIKQEGTIYEKPVPSNKRTSVPNNISLTDTKLKINVEPPTPQSEQIEVLALPESRSRPQSESSSDGSQSEDNPTLRVYEISLKKNLKKGPVYPSGVCVGPSNNTLLVWDTSNCCITMLSVTGKFIDFVCCEEAAEKGVNEPVHVCTDTAGNILVLDASPPRILKFSNTGKYVSRLVPKGLRSCPLLNPQGMALTHQGHILVTDWGKSCIHVFDSSGKHIKSFGSDNASSGQFLMQPTGITVDGNGRVIITDGMAHHVWVYTPEGEVLNHFGWYGLNAGELRNPFGVAVDSKGFIYITEVGNKRVSVFKESGEHLKCFGHGGCSISEFNNPKYVCIDSENKLIVADEGNHRLQVFDIS